jgi:putative ABC transport system substrate-binding protein
VSPPAATKTAVRRIGILGWPAASGAIIQPDIAGPAVDETVNALRELGWVDGENLAIEYRFAGGHAELVPELAAELVRLPIELILVAGTQSLLAAMYQTSTIPIVFNYLDPLTVPSMVPERVQSLGHPGGNVTGTSTGGVTLTVKSVELFKTVIPTLSRLAILVDRRSVSYAPAVSATAEAAQRLGIQSLELDVRSVEDVDDAFKTAMEWGAEGFLLQVYGTDVMARAAELGARNRLPAMNDALARFVTRSGGLMAFCADIKAVHRQDAEYIDKILRGASPADLPIVEPRQFDFIVNVKAAQALGITFPPDAAAQVTQWIE